MKNIINYFYNMYPNQIHQTANYYYFTLDGATYVFFKCPYEEQEITDIYRLHLNILARNLYVHQIIPNRHNELLTKVKNDSYILLRKTYEPSKIEITDIINFSEINMNQYSNGSNWAKLWSQKNDYLEYQTSMLGLKYPLIRESFSYYLGLAETAIELVNAQEKTSVKLSYSHRRLNLSNLNFNFHNPLNLKIDLKVRDAAEYFKEKFFEGKAIDTELSFYFQTVKLSTYEYIMFLARLIYPTYYFDMYEQIISGKVKEQELNKIIAKNQEFENQIKKIYNYYKSFLHLTPIEWLEN